MTTLFLKTVKLIAILPLVLLNIVILSIIIILTSPFLVFRSILAYFVPIFKPNLLKILNLPGTFMALGHKNPLALQVLAELKIDGQIDIELFRKDFQEKVIDLENSQGQLVYPEMRQIFTNFCGYLFWTNSPCFEIQDHIGFWPNSGNFLNTSEIRSDIENLEFPQNSPQWYFHFLENCEESGTICILKFHHSYMDGLSAIKLISKLFSQSKPYEEIKLSRKSSNIFNTIYKLINTPVTFTHLILDILGNKIDFGKNQTNADTASSENTAEIFQSTNMITFKKIKKISKIHNVNDSSVILAGICGGIRNYLLQNECKIPKKVPLFIPLKKSQQQHPDNKLTNHIYMGIIFLELGESDPSRRLKIIYENSKSLQNDSYLLQFIYLLTICLSNLPKPIFQNFLQLFKFFPSPLFYSGIPGPKPKWTWNGLDSEISRFIFSADCIGLPLILTSISNNTGLRFNGSGSKYHFNSRNSLKTLLTLIEEEFNILESKNF